MACGESEGSPPTGSPPSFIHSQSRHLIFRPFGAFFFLFFFWCVPEVLELPFARVKGREQVCDSRVRCQGCGLGEQPCESCAHFGRSNSRTCCREGVCWPVITDRAVPLGVDEIALSSRCRREQRTEIKMASLAKERVPMVD